MTLCPALGVQILRFAQNADYPHTVDLVGINAAEVFRKQKVQPHGWTFLRAEYEIRTRDPQLGKLMLYQLS